MKNKLYDAIFYAAFALRLAGMWIPQLWYDENFTLILARLPFDRMIAATAGDVHPPLWYIIEWGWLRLFPDPGLVPAWTLRIPAFACSLFALVAFRRLLDHLHIPRRVKIAALVLMAIMPMQLWYAQEARMYALLELEVILTLLFALRRNYIALFVASLAMLYTQNYSVFYLASVGVAVMVNDAVFYGYVRKGFKLSKRDLFDIAKPTMKTGVTFALAALAFAPWVSVIASQMTTISGRYWIQEQGIGDVLNILYKLFWASAMPSFALLSALLVTFMAITAGAASIVQSEHPAKRTVLLMAFGPLVLAWLASVLWQPILLFRPLIGISPFLYIVTAWGVEKLYEANQFKRRREAVVASALLIPILVSGLGGYYKNIPSMKNDGAVSSLTDAFGYVAANWQAGDVLFYTDDGPMINLLPYAGDLPQYEMIVCGDRLNAGPVLGSLSPNTRAAIGIRMAKLSELEFKRAWVFAPRSPLHPQCYEDQIASFTAGDPLIVVDDNQYISSGVWLIEK